MIWEYPCDIMYINNFNYILLMAKYFVYKKRQAKETIELYDFLRECKIDLQHKEMYMISAGKDKDFEKEWQLLTTFF